MINYTSHNNITKVLIDTDCLQKEEQTYEHILVNEKNINLSFVGIKHISPNMVKLLSVKRDDISINTDSKTLWNYCRKLNIDMKYKNLYYKNRPVSHPIKAIALGGSAGALGNIIKIIKDLPYSDIVVFVVIHILPNEKNQLVNILQQCTNYIVKEPSHGEKIETNHIYIAQPDMHMVVQDQHIFNTQNEKVNFCRPSIDVLFKTLAIEYKESLLAILTCGYLDDGTKSLKEIKEQGGLSLVQNPNECEANEIPLNAIATKDFTQVMGISHIVAFIKQKLNASVDIRNSIDLLVEDIFETYGYDFRHYDKASLIRRVDLLRQELNFDCFYEFRDKILGDIHTFKKLFKKLSINVTDFFRDPHSFKQVRDEIIPILETYPHIRIWCSACSSGQEPYSVAIMLQEAGLLDRSIIYATDFNADILQDAKNGVFPKHEFDSFKQNYYLSGGKENYKKWFNINENYIEVVPKIKEKVQFFQHNLATDSEINEFHMVFCRNVLIYFDDDLQKKVFELIYHSLVRKGFFILGESENVHLKEGFVRFNKHSKNKIFQKVESI